MNNNYFPPQSQFYKINSTSNISNNSNNKNTYIEKTYISNITSTKSDLNNNPKINQSSIKVTKWSIKIK